MMKSRLARLSILCLTVLPLLLLACGGGGGDGTVAPTTTQAPELSVLPADYDFGIETADNSVQPLEVTIQNTGTANLVVSNIELTGTQKANYSLDLNGGAAPCASAAPTIGAGSECTVVVDFAPSGNDTFTADLTILSNDPTTPQYDLGLLGSKQAIGELNVNISQISACPRPDATVYVSVTDQGGFAVKNLTTANFSLSENGGTATAPGSSGYVQDDATATISVSLLMDYSGSIKMEPDNVADMENAAISFINQLGADDEAEIIKYATDIAVMQGFTSDSAALITAIRTDANIGTTTALYDAISRAIDDLSTRTKTRQAIIVITDGDDNDGTGNPLSDSTLTDVIAEANASGISVFSVGLGNADETSLQQLADETGGTYSPSTTSDNLATIYDQLATLLFTDQYVLTYTSGLASTASGQLTVTATSGGLSGSATKTVEACP